LTKRHGCSRECAGTERRISHDKKGGLDRKDPRVSPLYADLRGFPPTLIQVGSAETLLADATRLAAALGGTDVPVTLEVWPHMIHAWPLWNAHLEPARRALASAGAFLRSHT
jgi:acetyl esterase/lipase